MKFEMFFLLGIHTHMTKNLSVQFDMFQLIGNLTPMNRKYVHSILKCSLRKRCISRIAVTKAR